MRLLVCGGREFDDQDFVWRTLDNIHSETPIAAIIQGGARGADYHAKTWARQHPEIERYESKAQWNLYGNAAGLIRNSHMMTWKPDVVLAFPGGSGTADMVRKARAAGVPVIEIDPLDNPR